jgi:hypothetical protein
LNDIKPLLDAIEWLAPEQRQAVSEGNARRIFSRLTWPEA